MKKQVLLISLMTMAGAAIVYAGCGACGPAPEKSMTPAKAEAKGDKEAPEFALCGGCGEIKGSKGCCDKEAKRCKCGAIKASPGCCKLPEKGKDAALCKGCGEIKGSEGCCDKEAKRCKCGAIKGSPGCCKLPAADKVKDRCGTCEKKPVAVKKAAVKPRRCCPNH